MYTSVPTLSRDALLIFMLICGYDETKEGTTGFALTFGPCDVKYTQNYLAKVT